MSDLTQLAERVLSLEKRVAALEAHHTQGDSRAKSGDSKELSVKEFIISKKPSNDVEKTLAIGYFLERYAEATSFNIDDLGRYFELAKEPVPTNINDKVNLNIKKGHLAEAREKKNNKKAWMVTNSGEKFVEDGFKAKK
jgi:hypothetical protein